MKQYIATTLLLLAAAFGSADVNAHSRSESYSHWHVSGKNLTATITIPLREVMLLYQVSNPEISPRELFHQHLVANIGASAAGNDCELSGSNILQAASGFIRVEVAWSCREAAADAIRFRAMFEVAPAHVHYAKLHRDGIQVDESLFTDTTDSWEFGALGTGANYSFLSFLGIGVEHIAGGIDHIAFLFGLLLIAGSIGRSIIAVTGFTLGHSISLAAAVLGYVHADSQLVEAFIGFTVALVAVEYFLLRRQDSNRLALLCLLVAWATGLVAVVLGFLPTRALFAYVGFGVFAACYLVAAGEMEKGAMRRATLLLFVATCCFGLVHGFGFAGFLMETGLLGTTLFMPLLGFNLGVEVGQLILVAITLVGGMLVRDHVPQALPQFVAAALCGIGVFWFVSRTVA